jgi:hypothetical protein
VACTDKLKIEPYERLSDVSREVDLSGEEFPKSEFMEASLKCYNKAKTFVERLDVLKNVLPTELRANTDKSKSTSLNFRDLTEALAYEKATVKAGKDRGHRNPNELGCAAYNTARKEGTLSDALSILKFNFSKDNAFPTEVNRTTKKLTAEGKLSHTKMEAECASPNIKNANAVKRKGGQIETAVKKYLEHVRQGVYTMGGLEVLISTLSASGEGYNLIARGLKGTFAKWKESVFGS